MAGKVATRNVYGQTLAELANTDSRIICLDADLANATMSKYFKAAHPDRFYDCGIAEADMMDIAAGFAACGYKPFASTFAIFAAGRAYEQVRNSIGYPHLNVVVVGSHGGVSVGEDGATHQAIEDLSLMRTIPGMLVCCPCDGNEMKLAVKALTEYDGPAYLRLHRPPVDIITDEIEGYSFRLGKGVTLRDGSDIAFIATGALVQQAMKAAAILAREGISTRVIDMHTIKPLDEELVLQAARETGCIVTGEEHSVLGGLGSAVCETVSAACPVPVLRLGVNDQFGRSGKALEVMDYFGLNADGFVAKAKQALALKK